jgi:hypothetical protein
VCGRSRMSLPATRSSANRVGRLRQVLFAAHGLPPARRAALGRRVGRQKPTPGESAYTREEFDRFRAAAVTTFHTALVRIRTTASICAAGTPMSSRAAAWTFLVGEALDSVLRTGDVPLMGSADGFRMLRQPHQRVLGGCNPEQTWGRLFLTPEEAFALAVLPVASQDWNRRSWTACRCPATTRRWPTPSTSTISRSAKPAARPGCATPPTIPSTPDRAAPGGTSRMNDGAVRRIRQPSLEDRLMGGPSR